MNRKISLTILTICGIVLLVYLANYFTLKQPVASTLSEDSRNETVELSVRYSYYVNPNIINISLSECKEAAPVDIFRAFLQTAEALKSRDFSKVGLYKGFDHRFTIDGNYFKKLGEEYNFQNPIYTARTFPEKVMNPDGSQAYHNYQRGLAGLSEEMETFKEFTLDWCI